MEPAERTAAVEEPVIMPGNMMMSMMTMGTGNRDGGGNRGGNMGGGPGGF